MILLSKSDTVTTPGKIEYGSTEALPLDEKYISYIPQQGKKNPIWQKDFLNELLT